MGERRQRAYLIQNFEPYVLRPVGRNGSEKESLKLDVLEHQVTVHSYTGCDGHFAVEIPRSQKVVQSGLQGKFIHCSSTVRLDPVIVDIDRLRFIVPSGFMHNTCHLILE
jgi:hypothetical protein